jgi:hypothetical protein
MSPKREPCSQKNAGDFGAANRVENRRGELVNNPEITTKDLVRDG